MKKMSWSTNFHPGIRVVLFVSLFDDRIMMGSTLVKRFFFGRRMTIESSQYACHALRLQQYSLGAVGR